ncbi:hypothetical protein GCM10009534_48140 [Kribbella sandramycini]
MEGCATFDFATPGAAAYIGRAPHLALNDEMREKKALQTEPYSLPDKLMPPAQSNGAGVPAPSLRRGVLPKAGDCRVTTRKRSQVRGQIGRAYEVCGALRRRSAS